MDIFSETLRSWHNFYFMGGGVAATLMGLMFVAVSLGMPLVSAETRDEVEIFVAPSIIYFVSALLLCFVMLAPAYDPETLGIMLFLGGVAGLSITIQYVRPLIRAGKRYGDFTWVDWAAQVILPVFTYLLILLAALGFMGNQWSLGFRSLWLVIVLLLGCAMANTWSLVIWVLDQRRS